MYPRFKSWLIKDDKNIGKCKIYLTNFKVKDNRVIAVSMHRDLKAHYKRIKSMHENNTMEKYAMQRLP